MGEVIAGSALGRSRGEGELDSPIRAARARLGLFAALLGLAALAWWSTIDRMAGMNAGPGTDLGALGWFLGVWTVMMAAMMVPGLAPTLALYGRMTRRPGVTRPLLFAVAYLLVWGVAGLAAYGLFEAGRSLFGVDLAWHSGGRWLAGGVLATAAIYELTPLKHVCLGKCRSPAEFLSGSWRDGATGALQMGARHAAWCLGCCWALMAALFALGIMSITWMALLAASITLEKTLPWRRATTVGSAALLTALAALLLAAPHSVPGLVVPGTGRPAMAKMPAQAAKPMTPSQPTPRG